MLDKARYRLSTVLTGLISHERRLTQRIVELARDPFSYFGNLVSAQRRKPSTQTLSSATRRLDATLCDQSVCLGERAPRLHPGDDVEPLVLH